MSSIDSTIDGRHRIIDLDNLSRSIEDGTAASWYALVDEIQYELRATYSVVVGGRGRLWLTPWTEVYEGFPEFIADSIRRIGERREEQRRARAVTLEIETGSASRLAELQAEYPEFFA